MSHEATPIETCFLQKPWQGTTVVKMKTAMQKRYMLWHKGRYTTEQNKKYFIPEILQKTKLRMQNCTNVILRGGGGLTPTATHNVCPILKLTL